MILEPLSLDILLLRFETDWKQNWARNCRPPDVLLANTLSTYVKKVYETFHMSHNGNDPLCPGTTEKVHPVTDFTLKNWTPSPQMLRGDWENMIDYPVIELARGVPLGRLPRRNNRQLLTRVVEEVIRTNDHELMLSQVVDYVVANGLHEDLVAMPPNADQLAIDQLRDRIKDYRRMMNEWAKANDKTFN
jgi:hypothetical protein